MAKRGEESSGGDRGPRGDGERRKLAGLQNGSGDGNDDGERWREEGRGDRRREERGGLAPQARKLGKSQGRGCAWCAGQPEGASSGSSCALPLGRAIGGAFLPANTCPGERVLAPERRE